ncbi:hypothetical protein COEREDRAFT_89597 [Coemansia reversa NRRL 1564]|uniref:Uncharacterized protein n=1 Tax=Coemansia reversa (strain ATCC 12441 / NRRL 1564) TaxID=763665 RepID=A0A2G5B2Z8_COERN|nr:hypothetical protein COEREDRAFT_89597 [Coemansia reversa NRRL 1564]|eukprot:PIA13393.1 hypothetical protein COEREDRAFT_89597 [Coemansia reversa NRRL 1564]
MDDLEKSIIENTPLFVVSSGSSAREYRRSSLMLRTSNSSIRQRSLVAQHCQYENGQLDSTSQQARNTPGYHSHHPPYILQSSQEHQPNEQVEMSTAESPANYSNDTAVSDIRRSSTRKENNTDSVYTQQFGIDRPRLVHL